MFIHQNLLYLFLGSPTEITITPPLSKAPLATYFNFLLTTKGFSFPYFPVNAFLPFQLLKCCWEKYYPLTQVLCGMYICARHSPCRLDLAAMRGKQVGEQVREMQGGQEEESCRGGSIRKGRFYC